ncbi:MAG: TfoX/Sxy family protein [Planctomycetes bacterium]|nr:TfoX/Sxy family protein [Planctomycetota bacterium]
MALSAEFIAYVTDQFSGVGAVTVKRMFGGGGVYLDGRMFALVDDDVLYLKGGDNNRETLKKAGCKAFEPWPGHKMDYYSVPADVLEDRAQLARWSQGALVAATSKTKKKSKPPIKANKRR